MSRLNHLVPKKQFRCLVNSGGMPFRYVESVPNPAGGNNYPPQTDLVVAYKIQSAWDAFYYLSTRKGSVMA